jgi:hypothetical protein
MNDLIWSKSEKVIARRAFDTAYKRECDAILGRLKGMVAVAKEPDDIWQIHNFLTEQRDAIDEKYRYRYSILIFVFARLLNEGWLKLTDLEGLGEEKIKEIVKLATTV